MAEMKATSLREAEARMPTCHSFVHPGHIKALQKSAYRPITSFVKLTISRKTASS